MKNPKILHLANDEKFIDHAIRAFERAAPGANDLYIYSKQPLKLVKTPATIPSSFSVKSGNIAKLFSDYDLIIIHSLNPAWFNTILKLPKNITLVWMGWGYDYYDTIYFSREQMLLPLTSEELKKNPDKNPLLQKIKTFLKRYILPNKKRKIIERVNYFSPVLPAEYSMVKKHFSGKKFPEHTLWNYGNLEEDLIKGFEDKQVTGTSILVGNSASAENNHIDAFSILQKLSIENRIIVSPLSYGNSRYGKLISRKGTEIFGENFNPLINFTPIDEYLKTLTSCGFVIMNHVRQQAVGNIVIMIHLGAKIFLREECPTYSYFRDQGIIIFSVQELQQNPDLICVPLDPASIATNRKILRENWSKEASDTKTKKLLTQACQLITE